MTLGERQFSIDGYQFGRDLPIDVAGVDFGFPDVRQVDADNPRADGTRMGRDQRGGRTITLELFLNRDSVAGRADLGAFQAAWQADGVRSRAGEVSVLSYRLGGEDRRVYGRGRKAAPDSAVIDQGGSAITAEFQTVDHAYYSDVEYQSTLGIVPPSAGGLIGPLIGPWIATGTGQGSQSIEVSGDLPAWLVCTIHGPISQPVIEATGLWVIAMNITLASDQTITIDPTPWVRSARRSDGANLSGRFTPTSARLPQMTVPPGTQQVFLRGVDATGTAALTVRWRSTFASY